MAGETFNLFVELHPDERATPSATLSLVLSSGKESKDDKDDKEGKDEKKDLEEVPSAVRNKRAC
jgi:hypothetical protein